MNQPPLRSGQGQASSYPGNIPSFPPFPVGTRAIISRVFRVCLYGIGAFVVELGIFGIGLYAFKNNSPIECIGGFLGLFLAGIGLVLFFSKGYYRHGLRWIHYLWLLLGTTVGGFIILFSVFGVTLSLSWLGNILGSCVLAFYGIALIGIAYLQPPLHQKIAERVPVLLHAIPSRQLPLDELVAWTQREYSCSNTAAYQYINTLPDLEQVDVPGISTKMCRMKQSQKAVAFSQTPTRVMYTLGQEAQMPSPPMQVSGQGMPIPVPARTPRQILPPNASMSSFMQPVMPRVIQPSQPIQPQAAPQNIPVHGVRYGQNAHPTPGNQGDTPPLPPKEEKKAVKVFFCYAHEDKHLRDQLDKHLSPLKRLGQIISWYDKELQAGTEWEKEIEKQITTANIILLLISPDFISSDYCYSVEMQKALALHKAGQAHVIPVILRPVDWKSTPIKALHVLPPDGKPVTTWSNRDKAYAEVAHGIRIAVETMLQLSQRPSLPSPRGGNPPLARTPKPVAVPLPQAVQEVELVRARCTQGKLIVTNTRIIIELRGFGQVIKSQMLLRSSLSSVESKLAVTPVFGMGGGINLIFHGKGRERLTADLVPIKESQAILALLGRQ